MIYFINDACSSHCNPDIFNSAENYENHYALQGKRVPRSIYHGDDIYPAFKPCGMYDFLQQSPERTLDFQEVHIDAIPSISLRKGDLFVYSVSVHFDLFAFADSIHLVDDRILELARADKCMIIFDGTFEGNDLAMTRPDRERSFLDTYYRALRDNDLPPKNILYLDNSMTAADQHMDYVKGKELDQSNVDFFLYDLVNAGRLFDFQSGRNVPYERAHMTTNTMGDKEILSNRNSRNIKHFLRLNRTPTVDRDFMLGYSLLNGFADKCITSHRTTLATDKMAHHIENMVPSKYTSEFRKYTSPELLLSNTPIDIDDSDRINRTNYNADLPFDTVHYLNSGISLVSTSFPARHNAIHLTASTFNPIYFLQPFLMFSHVHALRYMRGYGFKTFGKWFDESYDDMTDYHERLMEVCRVAHDLSKFNERSLRLMLRDMEKHVLHNKKLLMSHRETMKVERYIRKML